MKQENENYTVKEEAGTVIILDNSLNIGLRFIKGETLQYYNADLLLNDFSRMNNEQETGGRRTVSDRKTPEDDP